MKNSELKLGAILSYIILGLELVVGLFYTPILTRSLGQAEYGLYSLVASIISYLTVLDLGFGSAIVVYTARYRANNEKEKENRLHGMFLIIYTIIGIVAGAIGYILYLNVDKLFGNSMTLQEIEKAKVMMLILTANLVITFPMSIFSSTITLGRFNVFILMLNIYSPKIPIKNNIIAPKKKIPTVIDAMPNGYESQYNIFLTITEIAYRKLKIPIITPKNVDIRINFLVDEVIPCIANS